MNVVPLPDGRVVVPDNRWDMAPTVDATPEVGVVIPYYDQPEQLALVLAGLAAQTYPLEKVHVTVADDGSRLPLVIDRAAAALDITVVRQDDHGFRAAAARNLGAAHCRGTVLCFLDADTVPEPDYLRNAVRLPAAVPDALVVGQRLHADLSALGPAALADWIANIGPADPRRATEPLWLTEAYRRTDDLRDPGWDAYRFMISAVLTCSRELFDAVGGFDESFVEYGGEDWEFANRAFMAGAVFAHCPAAVAWHDGPDWAARDVVDRTDGKNAEALAVAPLVTDPAARPFGLVYSIPDCIVTVDTAEHTAPSLLRTVASALAMPDVAVYLLGAAAEMLWRRTGCDDSRVRLSAPDFATRIRARLVLDAVGRVVFEPGVARLLAAELAPGGVGVVDVRLPDGASVTARSSRCINRALRWSAATALSPEVLQERLFGVRTCTGADVGITVDASEPQLWW